MEAQYWKGKWKAGDIGFHQSEVEPLLVKHFSALKPGKVLVPLSGKSLDMIWLKSKGWQVVGVELASVACQAFFEENGISFSTRTEAGFTVFDGDGITIWCGDVFELPKTAVSEVTAIYDRAALIALPSEMRKRYVERLSSLATPKTQMLTLAIEYPQEKVQGPPFSVQASEIQQNYDGWNVREVYRVDDPSLPTHNAKFAGLRVYETAYWMKKL